MAEPDYCSFVADPVHYYEDGNVVFLVGTSKFRVFQSLLARRSLVMNDLFGLPQPTNGALQPVVDGVPAITLQDDPETFRSLLDLIFPQSIPPKTPPPERLIDLHTLSLKYCMDDLVAWCQSELKKELPTNPENLHLLSKYRANPPLALKVVRAREELPDFGPLAHYALATMICGPRSNLLPEGISTVELLQISQGYCALQREVLQGPACLHGGYACPGQSTICRAGKNSFWTDPVARRTGMMMTPLEELESRKNWNLVSGCARCSSTLKDTCAQYQLDLISKLGTLFSLEKI